MKLERLSALAEIVSSIAIVLTLVYLAIQTQQLTIQAQQTSDALLTGSRQATMMADITLLSASISNPEVRLNIFRPEITEVEFAALAAYIGGLIRVREFAWFQYRAGIMDEAAWRSYIAPIARILSSPQGEITWRQLAPDVDPEFASQVQQLIDSYAGE